MANFVLTPGAWHGSWCFEETAQRLRDLGHTVLTPDYTGVAKPHENPASVTLEMHAQDVLDAIEEANLSDVVLCGHSYGGLVISSVADRIPDRIRSLVYIDAFLAENGQSLIELCRLALPAEIAKSFIDFFRKRDDGLVDPIPAAMFNIAEQNRARVDANCLPHPLVTFEEGLQLQGGLEQIQRRTYILADGWDPSPYRYFASRCEATDHWKVAKLPCSHDAMVDMPRELADLLAEEAN